MSNLNTTTARKIYKAHKKDEIFSAIVFGKRGLGKSSFCMKVIYDIFHNALDYDKKKAWEEVIKHTLSSKEQVSDRASNLRKNDETAWALHWDDIGQWMSSDIWQQKGNEKERKLLFEIRKLVPVMRTRSSGNLFSCDNPNELDPSITDRPHHIIKIVRGGNDDHVRPRTARVYPQDIYPSFQRRINPDTLWTHKFDALLPNWFFKLYDKMRTNYADRQIKRTKQKREELRKEEAVEKYKISAEQAAYLYLRNQPDVTYREIMSLTGVNRQTINNHVKKLKKKDLDFDD